MDRSEYFILNLFSYGGSAQAGMGVRGCPDVHLTGRDNDFSGKRVPRIDATGPWWMRLGVNQFVYRSTLA